MNTLKSLTLFVLMTAAMPLLAAVTVDGIDADMRGDVRGAISLSENCDQPRWLVRHRFRAAHREIEQVLETFGYYSPSISSRLDFTDDCFEASFGVDAGPPTLIEDANVEIAGRPPVFSRLLANQPLGEGQRFDHQQYENFKSLIEDTAGRYGFVDGQFTASRVEVDALDNRATIDLVYEPGPRFSFGELRYPNDVLDAEVLARFQTFERGDPYDAEALNGLYRALLETGYFEDVVVTPLDAEAREIPVEVLLMPGRTRKVHVGIGVSTDLGPGLVARQDNSLVNRAGHQYSIDLAVSAIESELGFNYRIPQADVAEGWLSLYGGLKLEDTETSRTQSSTLGARRIVPRGNGWIETTFLETNYDEFDVAGTSDSTLYVTPGINYTHLRNDSVLARPRYGHRLGIELSGTSQSLGSSIDFASVRLEGRIVRSLTERIRFLGRARLGYTESDNFDKLPTRVRFFSGGDSRVRGFDFETIGVTNESGEVIGGDRLIEYSVELDHAIGDDWAVAAFSDAASVSISDFSGSFRRSAGIGLRWYSPLGPIRFDIAKPIDSEGGSIRFHLRLGPDV